MIFDSPLKDSNFFRHHPITILQKEKAPTIDGQSLSCYYSTLKNCYLQTTTLRNPLALTKYVSAG